eukprot:369779_1
MIDMNGLLGMACGFDGKKVNFKHIPGPEGVRGRNSNNDLIKKVLGWAPPTELKVGMKRTYDWIKEQIRIAREKGSKENFLISTIVKQDASVLDNIGGLLDDTEQKTN